MKHLGNEVIIACRPYPVYRSISCHYGICLCFFYNNLISPQINFTQSSFRNNTVCSKTSNFLIIGAKVLYGSRHSCPMHSPDLCCCHFSGNKRVLRKIFKVPSIQWMPVDIHSGSQKNINMIFYHFQTGMIIQFFHKFLIKCTGKHCAIWQTECFHTTVKTHSGRSGSMM